MERNELAEMIEMAKEGKQDAYAYLYKRYYSVMYMHAEKVMGSNEDADVVVQEAFINVFNSLDNITNPNVFYSYLKTAVRNRAINHISSGYLSYTRGFYSGKTADGEDPNFEMNLVEDQSVENDPQKKLDRNEKVKIVQEGLNQLKKEFRDVLYLYFYEDMKLREIADVLGVPMSTVVNRYNQGKNILKIILEGEFWATEYF